MQAKFKFAHGLCHEELRSEPKRCGQEFQTNREPWSVGQQTRYNKIRVRVPLKFQVSDVFSAFCIFSLGAEMVLSCLVSTSCFPGGFRDVNCRSGVLCHRRSCAGPS